MHFNVTLKGLGDTCLNKHVKPDAPAGMKNAESVLGGFGREKV